MNDLQLPMQSVPITTKVVSSNPTHGEVYSIQLYVIKFDCVVYQYFTVGCYQRIKALCINVSKIYLSTYQSFMYQRIKALFIIGT
jgi:hypothetical protein